MLNKILFFIALIFTLNISAQVYVPTSFTPNNDGINDYITFYTQDTLDLFEFTLFNKWGETVWFTKDPGDKWDGGDDYYSLDGVYTYVLRYRVSRTKLYKIKRGNITLIR